MRRAISAAIATAPLILPSAMMAQPRTQIGDAPKVELFTPAPDAPVAPVIVPQSPPPAAETPALAPAPAPVAPPRAPAPARPAVTPSPAEPRSGGGGFFVPGGRQAPASAAAATAPATVAENFYNAYLQVRSSGVPNAVQRARLRPFITPALEAALVAADKAERDYHAKTKGEVPPLIEGDLFASLFEGATGFTVRDCTERPPAMNCVLQLTYVDPGTKQKVEWQDTLVLLRLGAGWRVNDISYGGKFAFGQTGLLSDILQIVVKESKEVKE